MKLFKTRILISVTTLTFTLNSHAASEQKSVAVDGSSTVFPITEAVAEEFQKANPTTKVTVGISGTGGGFKKFCRGEIDIQDASRPILKEEMESCKKSGVQYFELPIAFDALTVVVSHKNTWMNLATFEDLKKIWEPAAQGKILKWNEVNAKWPATTLKLCGAGSDSGTFDYFTEAVVGKAKSSRGDYTASEDDNTLVQGVANDKNALGYIPYAYYEANQKKIKALPVKGHSANGVAPTSSTVKDGSYPLSRPLFIYVSAKALGRAEVKAFVDFYLEQAASLAEQVKYVALPKEAYTLARKHLADKKLGTVYGGEQKVGLKIEEVLKKEAAL